jgi:two-component system sensor histidine kinase ChvG
VEFADVSPRHTIAATTEGASWAMADVAILDQILGLLVENAIKYSPEGGAIALRAARDGAFVVVQVEDEGIGMDREA